MKRVLLLILFSLFLPGVVSAAEIYLWPNNWQVRPGETFLLELQVNSDQQINALEGELIWQPTDLELLSVNTGGSIFDLWISEPTKFSPGQVSLVAGATIPWQGNSGKIANFLFKAGVNLTSTRINLSDNTKLIRADGTAEMLTVDILPAVVEMVNTESIATIITSNLIPDENKWIAVNTFDIHWPKQDQVEYSYLLTMDPTQLPDEIPESLTNNLQYENLPDGIYYFILRSRPVGGNWQDRVMRRAMIDTLPPEFTELRLIDEKQTFGLAKNLFFAVIDNFSGINQVTLSVNDNQPQIINNPWRVPKHWLKKTKIEIIASDLAGNTTSKHLTLEPIVPKWLWLSLLIIIIILLVVTTYILWQKRKTKLS